MSVVLGFVCGFFLMLIIPGTLTGNKGQLGSIAEDGPMTSSWGSFFLQLITRLENKYAELETIVEGIRRKESSAPARHSVAFMAQLSANLFKPEADHVVVFDDVTTNIGAAYDSTSGIFLAPVNGTYHFSLIVSSPAASGHLWLIIWKNNVSVGYVFLDGNTSYWLRRSATSTLHLTAGDRVKVKVKDSDRTLAGCCFHTYLTGFLIQAD